MPALSINRIGGLIRKQIIENKKASIIFPIVLFGVLFGLLFLPYTAYGDTYKKAITNQKVIFLYGLIIASAAYASLLFKDIRRNPGNIQYLTFPCSTGEKFLSGIILSVPVFLILYFLIFFIADFFACTFCGFFNLSIMGHYHAEYNKLINPLILIFDPSAKSQFGIIILSSFLTVQSAFMFGAVRFKETPFAYTMLSYTIISFGIMIVDIILVRKWVLHVQEYFTKLVVGYPQFAKADIIFEMIDRFFYSPILIVQSIFICLSFWAATYFEIKEKEI